MAHAHARTHLCGRACPPWWCVEVVVFVCCVGQDIESIDPVFYKSLREIMMNPIDDLYLCLTFSADRDEFGVRKTVRGWR